MYLMHLKESLTPNYELQSCQELQSTSWRRPLLQPVW